MGERRVRKGAKQRKPIKVPVSELGPLTYKKTFIVSWSHKSIPKGLYNLGLIRV